MGEHDGEHEPHSDEIRRPTPEILSDAAIVPERHVIRPPPNRFTHELVADAPYNYDVAPGAPEPDGMLPAGTAVVLLVVGADSYRVVDGMGLYVEIPKVELRPVPEV